MPCCAFLCLSRSWAFSGAEYRSGAVRGSNETPAILATCSISFVLVMISRVLLAPVICAVARLRSASRRRRLDLLQPGFIAIGFCYCCYCCCRPICVSRRRLKAAILFAFWCVRNAHVRFAPNIARTTPIYRPGPGVPKRHGRLMGGSVAICV